MSSAVPKTRTTSMERITDPIAEAGRDSIDDVRAEAAGPSLIKVTLLGIAAKAFADWMKNLTSTAGHAAAPRLDCRQDEVQSLARERIRKHYQDKS